MQQYAVRIRPRRKEVTVPLPWRTPEVADTVFSTPDDGCMRPETCRVTWQRINVCILLHRVEPLLTLIILNIQSDAKVTCGHLTTEFLLSRTLLVVPLITGSFVRQSRKGSVPHRLTFSSLLVTWCTNRFNIQQLYAVPTLYLCVLYLSENKQRLVPLTA